jgi:hypothetical protein
MASARQHPFILPLTAALAVASGGVLGGCERATPRPQARATAEPPAIRYVSSPLGDPAAGKPMITHLALVDLDDDSLLDVLACDGATNSVRWLRQNPRGTFTEQQIGDSIQGPVHTALADINGDGRQDVLVASMGVILPNHDRVGSVIVLENLGLGRFQNRVIRENIARVTDVRAADFNGDGRLDLAVGQFGYFEGEIQWLENRGAWNFEGHSLHSAPGTVHTPVVDFDLDGRPDIGALVSQDAEEVRFFRNRGDGEFQPQVIWKSLNPAWASSGMEAADVNRDGRADLVVTNGDGFDGFVGVVPWHGVQWFENRVDGFRRHTVGAFSGAYSPAVADLDGDGDQDIVAVSTFNNWRDPKSVSLMAWLNDGRQGFQPVPLAHTPTHLITVAVGDLDGDGRPELVTGGFHVYPPWNHMSRITLWKRQ